MCPIVLIIIVGYSNFFSNSFFKLIFYLLHSLLSALFGLLSSSSLLSVQRLGRCALRSSSGIFCRTRKSSWEPSRIRNPSCRNRKPSRNFEPSPLCVMVRVLGLVWLVGLTCRKTQPTNQTTGNP